LRSRLIVFAALAALLWSCSDDERPYRKGRIDAEHTPTMTTLRANTTISDSGFLRYRILAPTWLMFENASEPRWTFPDGMHMERYDNHGRVNATIDCDSATYFTSTQTWRLDGAVDIASTDGQRFLTQQLWWNRLDRQVYSDSFIHIERADRVIEGYGFVSNERMTSFRVLKPSAILPVNQYMEGDEEQADSANVENADSVQPEPVKPVGRRSPQKRRSSVGIPLDTMSKFDVNPASVPRPGEVMRRKPRNDE